MGKQNYRQFRFVVGLGFIIALGFAGTASAAQSSSTHYSVTETQIGSGSSLHDCSTNYCAKTSVGDLTDGRASSANYSAQLGFNTSAEPVLEVEVDGGSQDMGVLDNSHTGTAVNTIKVRSYLSSGYVLQITGASPSQGTHSLKTMSPADCPCTSQPGTEQFGINLADNTSPNIGALPVQVPSGSFSYGSVVSGQDTVNGTNPNSDHAYFDATDMFVYQDGDVVAHSLSSTGETDYTMSMIINVSDVTPGGRYTGVYSAVAVPVF
jgi:hypothetical protein